MYLQKTEKARSELRPGVRTLGQRERTLLLLADGKKPIGEFKPMFEGMGEELARKLIEQGYLEQSGASGVPAVSPAKAAVQGATAPEPPAAPPAVAADKFDGKRSLATTRMYLFDLCERMFTRRDPMMATILRDGLREAKDRDAMLEVAGKMIAEIERVAGQERSESIREKIAMLLPQESAAA